MMKTDLFAMSYVVHDNHSGFSFGIHYLKLKHSAQMPTHRRASAVGSGLPARLSFAGGSEQGG